MERGLPPARRLPLHRAGRATVSSVDDRTRSSEFAPARGFASVRRRSLSVRERTRSRQEGSRNPSRVSRLLRMGPEASTATVSWFLPGLTKWSKLFPGLHSLLVSPNLERPAAAVRTIALILPGARVARLLWRQGASPDAGGASWGRRRPANARAAAPPRTRAPGSGRPWLPPWTNGRSVRGDLRRSRSQTAKRKRAFVCQRH